MLVDINKRFLQNVFCVFHQHGCHAFDKLNLWGVVATHQLFKLSKLRPSSDRGGHARTPCLATKMDVVQTHLSALN